MNKRGLRVKHIGKGVLEKEMLETQLGYPSDGIVESIKFYDAENSKNRVVDSLVWLNEDYKEYDVVVINNSFKYPEDDNTGETAIDILLIDEEVKKWFVENEVVIIVLVGNEVRIGGGAGSNKYTGKELYWKFRDYYEYGKNGKPKFCREIRDYSDVRIHYLYRNDVPFTKHLRNCSSPTRYDMRVSCDRYVEAVRNKCDGGYECMSNQCVYEVIKHKYGMVNGEN
jgi:hypothetical protein